MKITPTRVVLQCQVCEGPPFREFNYFHALKAHFDGNHGGQKLLFKKRVIKGMAIPVVEFSSEVYKIRKFFWLKINCSRMKSLNFANWCNGEVSKSAEI
jgi:hypothetical protein